MRKDWTRLLTAGAVAAGSLGMYAFVVEPRWIEVTHTRVPLGRLPAHLGRLRIALLTDFHVGSGIPLRLVRLACKKAMQARPDLIALTGDFTTGRRVRLRDVVDALSILHAPLGVYAVPGNHDHSRDIGTWHRRIEEQSRIVDLTNRLVVRQHRTARIGICGIDDLVKGDPDLSPLRNADPVDVMLLLSHNPDLAEDLCNEHTPVDLVLSGHTHGGQVRLPFLSALRNPSKHPDLYESGLQKRPWTSVYTSRGLGTVHLPVRLGARPEIAILDLVPAAERQG